MLKTSKMKKEMEHKSWFMAGSKIDTLHYHRHYASAAAAEVSSFQDLQRLFSIPIYCVIIVVVIKEPHTYTHIMYSCLTLQVFFCPMSYFAGGHVRDRSVSLNGLQLVQAPIQLLQGLDSDPHKVFICVFRYNIDIDH